MADLRPAPPEFYERVNRLVDAYFPHLQGARIQIEVRAKALTGNYSKAWGQVDTPDNDAEKAEFDFSMWFA